VSLGKNINVDDLINTIVHPKNENNLSPMNNDLINSFILLDKIEKN
jgi:hypothetical protein